MFNIVLNKQKGKQSFHMFALYPGSHVTHPGHLLSAHGRMEEKLWYAKGVW